MSDKVLEELEDLVETYGKEVKQTVALLEQYDRERILQLNSIKAIDQFLGSHAPIEFEVDGLIKTYKDVVDKSDGIAVMKPSIIKLFNAADEEPSKTTVKAVVGAINKEIKAASDEHGDAAKKDAALKKRLDTFVKEMKKIIADLEENDKLPN